MKLSKFSSAEERRRFLERKLRKRFKNVGKSLIEKENIHCENLIGGTFLPLGVAGPLKIVKIKDNSSCEVFIPLATTEGALVASVNRGCKAVSLSGGVRVLVEKVGTTRGPVFYVENIAKAREFELWLEKNFERIKGAAEATSSHLRLLRYEFFLFSPFVFLRFYFDTDRAMGMNMATIATSAIVKLVEKELGIKCISISGNFCVDKKASFLNFLLGRGFRAWAEVEINSKICKKVLKIEPEKIVKVWLAKNMAGSAFSGTLGFNAHFANIVTAFFSATGQDLAHTVEGSLGTTFAEVRGKNLYFSVHLPAVMVGVVGGGTKLKVKKEAIEITGAKTSEDLAEVLAGAVLAGELSLLASLAEGTLAEAHRKLGR